MIRIVSRMVVKKECIGEYQKLAEELVAGSRKEAGCMVYELNQGIQDERVHCFTEDWHDQAAIDAHNASAHFKKIVPLFGPLLEEKSGAELYRVLF